MSMTDFTFSDQGFDTVRNPHPTFISLNEIFKESLTKAQTAANHLQITLRCETLPHVAGNQAELAKLFDELLDIILKYPPSGSRLFLYLDCEEEKKADTLLQDTFRRFVLKFHTNAGVPDNWKVVNSQALVNCKQILSDHNGNLALGHSSRTGCLFSISLPGKI
jgi:hypothetical protein